MKKLSNFFDFLNLYIIYIVGPLCVFLIRTTAEDYKGSLENYWFITFKIIIFIDTLFNIFGWISINYAIKNKDKFSAMIYKEGAISNAKMIYLDQKKSSIRSFLFLIKASLIFTSIIFSYLSGYWIYVLLISFYLISYFALYERSKTFCIKYYYMFI